MHELKRVSDGKNSATLAYLISDNSGTRPFGITLLDGGNAEMTTDEFANAFALLLSDDFDELLELINNREKAHADMSAYYSIVSMGIAQDATCESDAVYELVHAGKRYGRFDNMVRNMKDTIIRNYSWDTWVDTCRLYESIYRVPREWIS